MKKSLFFTFMAACLFHTCLTGASAEEKKQPAPVFPIEQNFKWGLMDQNGKVLIKPRFDVIEDFYYGQISRVRTQDKWGLIDRSGRILLEPKYDEIIEETDFVAVRIANNWGFMDQSGKWIFSPQFEKYDRNSNITLHKQLFTVKRNGKWGSFDPTGKIAVPTTYDELIYQDQSDTFLARIGNKWGVVSANGTVIAKPAYSSVSSFEHDMALVTNNRKYGYINRQGKLTISPQYQYGYGFYNDYAIVEKNNRFGTIDKQGRVAIPFSYPNLVLYSNGVASTKVKDKWKLIDPTGKVISQTLYDNVQEYNNLIMVTQGKQFAYVLKQNNQYRVGPMVDERKDSGQTPIRAFREGTAWGWMDNKGNVIVPPTYQSVSSPDDDFVVVKLDGLYGVCDLQGKVIIPIRYNQIGDLSNGLFSVKDNGKWGVIQRNGDVLIPIEYEELSSNSESGLYKVKKDGKWGVVNQQGEILASPKYDDVRLYSDLIELSIANKRGFYDINSKTTVEPQFEALQYSGFPQVLEYQQGGKWGAIKPTGKFISPPVYDEITWFINDDNQQRVAKVSVNGKYGYMNLTGKEIVPPQFDMVGDFHEGFGLVEQNNKWWYVNASGQIVGNLQFDQAEPFRDGLGKVKVNQHVTYVNKQGQIMYQPVEPATTYQFTYQPFDWKSQDVWSILPALTTNTDPAYLAKQPSVKKIAQAYYEANGPFDRGVQIDSYNLNPATLLLSIYSMMGTLEPVKSGDIKSGETFVQALIKAKYVKAEELNQEITPTLVAHILYNIFHEANPSQGKLKLADTKDPALLWAVEKGIPGYTKDSHNKFVSTLGPYSSSYEYVIRFCAYSFKFPQVNGKGDYYPYHIQDIKEFQQPGNHSVNNALLVNGIHYEDIVLTRPELEADPVFIAAREKAKEPLLKEAETAFQQWLVAQRKQVAAK
ncbi:WG repeat-containing protein [Brevibacillus ginsengisoli]|uniref:WG repeat-containing protein n=1 Tax=Brevibacillus ginsengisoli TaxID=363854 RepID=UPI003CE8D9E4